VILFAVGLSQYTRITDDRQKTDDRQHLITIAKLCSASQCPLILGGKGSPVHLSILKHLQKWSIIIIIIIIVSIGIICI